VTVGLISDTHGLLRPDALRRLAGAELIIHAGDVGKVEILAALSAIAPVIAVRGNVDRTQELSFLPETAFAEADSRRIHVLHNIAQIDVDPAAAGFDVIVFGHSHKQELYTKSGVMFVNPGSAGPRRFRLPISIALLNTAAEPIEARFVEIEA
jgi:putative phosphoesterase